MFEELKPEIDRRYRTKPRANDTGMIGSSFGGIVTLTMGLTRPNDVRRLGVLSPSLWIDQGVIFKMAEALPKKLPLKLWIDTGREESPTAAMEVLRLQEILEGKGWKSGKDLVVTVESFAPHNEDAWARRAPSILRFLFPAR